MPNYQKMYHLLFNKITDIIEDLQMLQMECEDIYTNEDQPTLTAVLPLKQSNE